MTLPYHWLPSGTVRTSKPEPGLLVPFEHSAWRVIDVRDRADAEGNTRTVLVIRPASITSDDPRSRDHDLHISLPWVGRHRPTWDVYPDEHYPVCASCQEPLPCREQMAERISEAAAKRMGRYEVAGVCPSCSEPVTARQQSMTWPDNLEVLGGPPVTFHLRSRCHWDAMRYEQRWAAVDPEVRRPMLSCRGHVTNHNDGTYECTQLDECPGPTAVHPSLNVCRDHECHARGGFGCHPRPDAVRRST